MPDTITQIDRLLTVQTPLDQDLLLIEHLTASEGISSLFDFDLDLLAEPTKADSVKPEDVIGKKMTVSLALPDGQFRYFNGIVGKFSEGESDERFVHYEAELVPWLWLLTHRSDCRIFQDTTVPEIIKKVFDELKADFSDLVNYRDETVSSTYTKLDHCMQYRETDFHFVSRLMEQEGIFYFFEHEKDKHTLVLADNPDSCKPCPNQTKARFLPVAGTGEHGEEDVVMSWGVEREMRAAKQVLRDFNFQVPSKTLEVSEVSSNKTGNNGKLAHFDFPGEYAQRFNKPDERLGNIESEGRAFALRRIEEDEVSHVTINGSSSCRAFVAGTRFELTDRDGNPIKLGGITTPYVLTAVQHSAAQSPDYFSGDELPEPYGNSFICIPHGVPFRPPRVTPKPIVQGPQTAVVVGPKGEEIHTDKYGRVKVQFHWDREGKKDEKSSCWIRVAQSMAGKQWGAHFWPRIGQEVLVAFMEGDPDQPIIVGSVYNAENMPPYTMPDNQTRSGIKTRSSLNGSPQNFNELRFEDKKGQEEIYIHAEKDLNCVVENNETRKVGFDDKKDGDQTIEIFNNQKLTIGDPQAKDGSQTVEIWKDQKQTVKTGNRDVQVSTGDDALMVGGNQEITIGRNKQETVGGSATETVGQSKSETIGTGMTQNVGGQVSITSAGGFTLTNGGTTAVASGGPLTINSGGPVTINAPMVSLNAPMVQAAGVIQCTSLIASIGVVSPSYTPGAGNMV